MGPPKSRYGRREIPLDPLLTTALHEHHAATEWPDDEDPVFPAVNGSPLMPNNVFRRVLQPAREAADLPWVGFHALRHTCASILFAEGRNAVQVQRWLGHHSAAFTLATYVHLLNGDLDEPLTISSGRPKAESVSSEPNPIANELCQSTRHVPSPPI
jgi:integrase